MLHFRKVSGNVKHLPLRLAFLMLLSHPVLAGDAERQLDEHPADWLPDFDNTTVPSTAVPGAKSTVSLSPNLILGLFVGSALLSFTIRRMLRGQHRRPPVLNAPLSPAPVLPDLMQPDEHLLIRAEQEFFTVLEPLVRPVCRISIKVALADLFEVRPERGRQAAYGLISNKHVGFILTERETGRIVCGIELDALPSRQPGSVEYDAFVDQLFASQQLPLLLIPCARRYDAGALRQKLAGIIGKAHAG